MDPNTIDRLARLVGSGQSRRRVLKTVAGGALAALGLDTAASARGLRSAGNSCTASSDCASGLCVQESRTRKVCHCGSASDCPNSDLCHPLTCSVGACVPAAPVVCLPSDQCHTSGICNPATGACSNPIKTNGTVCDDGDASICNNVCVEGTCSGEPCTVTCDGGVCPVFSAANGHCYWLSNGFAGQIAGCWYPTETFNVTYNQQQCEAQHGCASGGCFKWSTSAC
jgi:hypothetical protein